MGLQSDIVQRVLVQEHIEDLRRAGVSIDLGARYRSRSLRAAIGRRLIEAGTWLAGDRLMPGRHRSVGEGG